MKVAFDEVRRVAFRALDAGGAAPGCDEDAGWACAWLEAAGYPGVKMLVEALDETPREARRPALQAVYGIVDLDNVSCVFSGPGLVDLARAEGRVVLNRVRHGLYALPFAVRAGLAIGCPVDPSFAIGGKRTGDLYGEKIAAAIEAGIEVDDEVWRRANAYSRAILVPESEASRLKGAGAGLTDND
jgi:hypothetical protein